MRKHTQRHTGMYVTFPRVHFSPTNRLSWFFFYLNLLLLPFISINLHSSENQYLELTQLCTKAGEKRPTEQHGIRYSVHDHLIIKREREKREIFIHNTRRSSLNDVYMGGTVPLWQNNLISLRLRLSRKEQITSNMQGRLKKDNIHK